MNTDIRFMLLCLTVTTALLLWSLSGWSPDYQDQAWLLERPNKLAAIDVEAAARNSEYNQPESDRIRCGDLSSRYPDSIPPLVHWTSKDGRVPSQLLPLVKSWRLLLNSSSTTWHFMHWGDEQIGRLISAHYPHLEASYSKLVTGLERSDIGRLVVLHHVGGVYVDTDVELRRDLSPLLTKSPALRSNGSSTASLNCSTAIWTQEPIEHAVFGFDMESLISNAVILTRANHSFLSYVLGAWPDWFEANWANRTDRSHGDAVHVTGPVMLHVFYERYSALPPSDRSPDWNGTLLADPDLFQPVWDAAYIPNRLRRDCANSDQLSALKRRHCLRLIAMKFREKPVPAGSFTVHRFKHLSYTDRMELRHSISFGDILPILNCTV